MLPDQKLDALIVRQAALERELGTVLPPDTYVKLSREFAELAPVVEAVNAYRAAQRELDGITSLIADPSTDAEMRSIADAERHELEARRATLEQQLRVALLPKDAMDDRNVILEIRAGTGGDEAALFAGDLFRMYERYAAHQGWKVEMVTASEQSPASTSASPPCIVVKRRLIAEVGDSRSSALRHSIRRALGK